MRIALVAFIALSCLAGPAAAQSGLLDPVCQAGPVGSENNGDVRDWRGIQTACCDEDGDNPYQDANVWIIRSPLTVTDSPAATCAADSGTRGWTILDVARDGPDHFLRGHPTHLDPGDDQIVEYTCQGNEFVAILYDCPCGVVENGTAVSRACRLRQPTDQPQQVLPGQNIRQPDLVPQPRAPIEGGMPVPGTPAPPRPRTQ